MLLRSVEEVAEVARKLSKVDKFSFDTETYAAGGPPIKQAALILDRARAKMISLYDGEQAYSIALGSWGGQPQLPASKVFEELRPVFEDERIKKIAHGANYDVNVFLNHGVVTRNFGCTLVAGWCVDENSPNSLSDRGALVGRFLKDMDHKSEDVDAYAAYAEEDVRACYDLYEAYFEGKVSNPVIPWVDTSDLRMRKFMRKWYEKVEIPIVRVCVEMERNGLKVCPDRMQTLHDELSKTEQKLLKTVYREAGTTFNVGSPKQLGEVLFDTLGMEPFSYTRTGQPSTDDLSLLNMMQEPENSEGHKLLGALREYRAVTKLMSTYTNPDTGIPGFIGDDGYTHPTLKSGETVTGRFASALYNQQNIPTRTDLGRRIRSAFIAEPGEVWIGADLSQIELRLIALFSQDATMLDVYRSGGDIHEATRQKLGLKKNERVIAKGCNFLVFYGGGAKRLVATLAKAGIFISEDEAQKHINSMKAGYPAVWRYRYGLISFVRDHGYMRTICGRYRNLPDINHDDDRIRASVEMQVFNNVIQASCLDFMKIWMLRVWRDPQLRRWGYKMRTQVHDEIGGTCPKKHSMKVARRLVAHVDRPLPNCQINVNIPIRADVKIGPSWGESQEVELN